MYRFYINNIDNDYHYCEMARVFLPDDSFEVIGIHLDNPEAIVLGENSFLINKSASDERDKVKRELYCLLQEMCEHTPEWGTLTGVRPLKNALALYKTSGNIDGMKRSLRSKYLLSDKKIKLLTEIAEYQLGNISGNPSEKIGIYIGIPFCPTRCAYCSFAANVARDDEIAAYLDNLMLEIKYMGELIKEHGDEIESIYIGGGTPTTLNSYQLARLIDGICEYLAVDPDKIEFTVEAGRPDTLTADKLQTLKDRKISRISINPQTMKDYTLKLIGRAHNSQDIIDAYELADKFGFEIINADLIAGLPEESLEDFEKSLNDVIELGANNITVHTLSIKRGSKLRDEEPEFYRKNVDAVSEMLDHAHKRLLEEGFAPYYIYKQKHQIGFLENVGYCKPGTHSLYNIRIMEEKQTIVGLGAGAIGKVYFPDEDRLERIPNVSNYMVYNERFEEILDRKNNYYGG